MTSLQSRALNRLLILQARHVRHETARRSQPARRMPVRTTEHARQSLNPTLDVDTRWAERIMELVHGC